jgi:hypothetical protein
MRRPIPIQIQILFPTPPLAAGLLALALSGCGERPVIHWPSAERPAAPALLPADQIALPPGTTDPGPALAARAAALKAGLGL